MPDIPKYDIGLTGINAFANSQAIQPTMYGNEFPLEQGYHLRWQLRSGLGLPARFLIYRTNEKFSYDTNTPDEFDPLSWKTEAQQIALLQADINALNQVGGQGTQYTYPVFTLDYGNWDALEWITDSLQTRGVSPSSQITALIQRYRNTSTVLELKSLIDNLQRNIRDGLIGAHRIYTMSQQVIEQDSRKSFRTSLKRMDTLNLAALDPHIARMAGFYFIDRYIPLYNGDRIGYFVVADYTGQEYPFNIVIPKREVTLYNRASEMRFEGFKAIPMGGTYLSFSDAAPSNLGFLSAISGLNPSIRIIFDEPDGIQEAIFTVKAVGASASDFWVTPNLYSSVEPVGGNIWEITVFDPNVLITPDGESRLFFKNVDIKVSNTRALIFQKVQFKYKVGQIGFIKSNPIILGGGVGEEKIQPLSLGRALAEPATPVLNEEGEYDPFTANVKLSLINKAQAINPEKPNVIAANSPVRAVFERTNLNNLVAQESGMTVIRGHNRVLPELIFYAPLASTAKDYATGQPLALFGKSRFVRDNPLEKKHSSLLIADNGGAYASEDVAFSIDETFTIDLWVKIKEGNVLNEYIPLVSFGGEHGVSFGFQQTHNTYTLQLKVDTEISEKEPDTVTPQFSTNWSHFRVSFNRGRVVFNDFFVIERRLNARFTPLTMGGIAIGMDFNAETQQIIRSFKGQICHVKIWNQAIRTPQADYLLREYAGAFPQQLISKSLYRLKEVLSFNDTLPTYQRFIYGINTLNAGFSMQFWLYIASGESALVLCDATTSFRFGVNYMSGGCFWENSKLGFLLNFDEAPEHGEWTHISFSQDANNLFKFYINGQLVGETLYDKYLLTRIDQPLVWGGELNENATFDGKIANFRLYPFPSDPIQTKKAFAINQLLETNIPETRYKFRAKGIDLFGRISEYGPAMAYQVKSDYKPNPPASLKAEILTFKTSLQSADLITPAQPEKPFWDIQLRPIPDFDMNVLKRHIITISGSKQAAISLTDKTLIQKTVSQKYEVKDENRIENRLSLKDVPFAQIKPNEIPLQNGVVEPIENVLIEYDSQVNLRWEWTGLQQIFNPGVTDFQIFRNIGLLNDVQVKITGVELIPDATNRKFRVQTDHALSGDANELNGKICLIDHRAYVITAHTAAGQAASFDVRYDGYPILPPQVDTFFVLTIPETQNDWKDYSKHENWLRDVEVPNTTPPPISIDNYQITSALLTSAEWEAMKDPSLTDKDKIVDWLPPENTWKLRVTNISKPPLYAESKANEYVTSALVVYCSTDNPPQGVWNTWYVLWHEWTDSYLDLYITVADQRQNPNINNEEIDEAHPKPINAYAPLDPTLLLVEGSQMRFYQGKSFNPKVGIDPPTADDQAMLSYHFAVASKTERGFGALSVKASVVAVNRQLPLEPYPPIIDSIGLADVKGNSEARISWRNTEGVYGYNLYRATDTAIFDKDLDNRRLAIGHYKMENKAEIFIDDLDFIEFIRAVRHKDPTIFAPDFQRLIGKSLSTIEPSDLCGKVKYSPEWNALTPIWQYWADRFYPACNTEEREAIANRNGNETAFTLVNTEPIRKEKYADPSRPITHVKYPDTVNGVVSNQYFYRLRTVGHNMALGSSWSPVSNGLGVSVPASRPRTPVWTKVEAGDRQVTLQWALNREPDFNEYILYRATDELLLTDVRWAEVEQPEGLVIRRIADPRILTSLRGDTSVIVFPDGQTPPPIASILGIYRAFEFDTKTQEVQVGAMNLLQLHTTRIVGNTIQNIRKVAKNTEGVIVWRNTEGVMQVMMAFGEYPYIDRTVEGLKEYQYKIASQNTSNVFSEASKISFAKALNEYRPNPPQWNPPVLSQQNVVHLVWSTPIATLRCIVQRKVTRSDVWENLTGWLARGSYSFDDATRNTRFTYNYRLIVMDMDGKTNKEFNILTI